MKFKALQAVEEFLLPSLPGHPAVGFSDCRLTAQVHSCNLLRPVAFSLAS